MPAPEHRALDLHGLGPEGPACRPGALDHLLPGAHGSWHLGHPAPAAPSPPAPVWEELPEGPFPYPRGLGQGLRGHPALPAYTGHGPISLGLGEASEHGLLALGSVSWGRQRTQALILSQAGGWGSEIEGPGLVFLGVEALSSPAHPQAFRLWGRCPDLREPQVTGPPGTPSAQPPL